VRELTDGEGVDVVLDGFGGGLSLRSFRALRSGGRLVVFGHSDTVANGTSLSAGEHSARKMRASGGSSFRNAVSSAVLPMPISPEIRRAATWPVESPEPTTP